MTGLYLGIISQVQSPTIRLGLRVIPVVPSPQPVTKERIKSALGRSVVILEESKMPLQ